MDVGELPRPRNLSILISALACTLRNLSLKRASLRILEHGLGALAKDVGITFDRQNWQNVIEQIESEIEKLRKTLSAGQPKSDRLKFLSEAAKEFFYFKDGWRNHVAHNRVTYDEHQAQGALEHVRAFMNHLSTQLNE